MKLKNKYKIITLFCATIISNSFAAVNDLIPSDYEPPLANSTVMSLNYLTKELNTATLPKDQYVKQNTYALRYTYGFDIDGKILALGVAVPYSDLKTHGSTLSSYIGEKSSGLSDTVFSATYWLINDRKTKDFLGLTLTHALSNGKYNESQSLNAGENRYKTTLALGYITKLSDSFLIELSPEIGFYGDNETATSKTEQKNSYALTSNLRYKPTNKYELFVGFQENYLKETIVNDIEQNNNHFYQKYSFGGAYYTDKFNQFMIRFASEADKEYGLKADKEMLVRYRWWFK
jgi:hypothetical protein